MPTTRSRLASKQDHFCKHSNKTEGENGTQRKDGEMWVHSACMGYSKDEYIFLGNSKNIHFLCNNCPLPTTGKTTITTREIAEEVAKLSESIDSVKKTQSEIASARQATTESTSTDKDKYTPSRPYLRNFELEVRLSCLPEMKTSIKEIQNEKDEKSLMKPVRKEIFEQEKTLFLIS